MRGSSASQKPRRKKKKKRKRAKTSLFLSFPLRSLLAASASSHNPSPMRAATVSSADARPRRRGSAQLPLAGPRAAANPSPSHQLLRRLTTPAHNSSPASAAPTKKQQQRGARTPSRPQAVTAPPSRRKRAAEEAPKVGRAAAVVRCRYAAGIASAPAPDGALEIDSVLAAELADNGKGATFR